MDRGAWRAIVHGVKELDATEATWHSQHAHRHFPCLPAPSSVLSLCISSLLTVRTTSESSEPMMLFRGIPSSAWGIYKRPHLLLGLLQLSSSKDEFQPCSWNPVLSLQLMVLLVKRFRFVVGEISVQILAFSIPSEQTLARYLNSLSLSFFLCKNGDNDHFTSLIIMRLAELMDV